MSTFSKFLTATALTGLMAGGAIAQVSTPESARSSDVTTGVAIQGDAAANAENTNLIDKPESAQDSAVTSGATATANAGMSTSTGIEMGMPVAEMPGYVLAADSNYVGDPVMTSDGTLVGVVSQSFENGDMSERVLVDVESDLGLQLTDQFWIGVDDSIVSADAIELPMTYAQFQEHLAAEAALQGAEASDENNSTN